MAGKRFLVRAGMAPYETYSLKQILEIKPYGRNVGNLVYAYGVFRALMKDEDTILEADGYRAENGLMTQADIDRINQTCAGFIVPLADAFRLSFCAQLRNLADVIRQLKIPTIVIGVGIKAPLVYDLTYLEPCNEDVRYFTDAVLEKSAVIGLRGEHTARYLKSLGYAPEIDFTPIGCPSMYCRGGELPIGSRAFPGSLDQGSSRVGKNAGDAGLKKDSRLILSNNVFASGTVHRFMNRVMEDYPDYIYIPQRLSEIRSAYYGMRMTAPFRRAVDFPSSYGVPPYKGGKVRMVLNQQSWWKVVRGSDLCVGPRLHGSIMCMLEGVPTLVLPRDLRTLEVCEYHSFAHWKQNDLTDEMHLDDLIGRVDFQEVSRRHSSNFEHYCDFLEKNGLEHVLKNPDIRKKAPLDKKLAGMKVIPPLKPYYQAGLAARLKRDSQRFEHEPELFREEIKKKVRRKLSKMI